MTIAGAKNICYKQSVKNTPNSLKNTQNTQKAKIRHKCQTAASKENIKNENKIKHKLHTKYQIKLETHKPTNAKQAGRK